MRIPHSRRAQAVLLAVASTVGGLMLVGLGAAAPAPSTTVVVACDRNVNSVVHVDLQPSLFDSTVVGSADVDCGPDSVSGLKRMAVKVPPPKTDPLLVVALLLPCPTQAGDVPSTGPAWTGDQLPAARTATGWS